MTWCRLRLLAPAVLTATLALCASPPAAQAFDASRPICTLAGLVSGLAGKVCSAARHAGRVLQAGQKLLSGHLGGAAETLSGAGAATKAITAAAALTATALWVVGGARLALHETAAVISSTTRPQLQSTWFSSSYWRMAGISALLTLPFLFAAAIQALVRSDLSLLARSALGYLPLSALAVAIAAPLTQLLLAGSDELSGLVSSASGYSNSGLQHVALAGVGVGLLSSFPVFFVGLLAVAATVTLWIELLIRSAAVYVIVLMLPLFFAALVWPARRIWALRAVELLMALILSKFAIVAVLALGGAALGHTAAPSVTQMLAGTSLVLLAAFTPWALLRLLPLHELAAGVEGMRGAGSRGLAGPDAGASNAFRRTEDFRDELEEARAQRPQSDTGQPSAARSAVEGLNAGQMRSTSDSPPEDDPTTPASEPAAPASDRSAPSPAPELTVPAPASEPTAPAPASEVDPGGATCDPTTPGTSDTPGPGRSTPSHTEPRPLPEVFSEAGAPDETGERLPGMDPQFQRRNLTWGPLDLGPDAIREAPLDAGGEADDHPEPR